MSTHLHESAPALPRVTLAGPGASVTPLGLMLLADAAEAADLWGLAGRLRWSAEVGTTLLVKHGTRRLLARALVEHLRDVPAGILRIQAAALVGRML